ncbi:hypothetical protein ACGFZU_34830 [Streptomyces tendae]|uniref:hypothetical protein n=1 Tax=Streptomyces tendae TaxID=1932 RepID=UPI00372114C5
MESLHELLEWLIDILTFLGLLMALKGRPLSTPSMPPKSVEEAPAIAQRAPKGNEALDVEPDVKVTIVILVIHDET